MTDKRISELPTLAPTGVASGDWLAIVDSSTNTTKKVSAYGSLNVPFESVAAFSAAVTAGYTAPDGTVVSAGPVQFQADSSAAIDGLPVGWKPFGDVYAEHFGSLGNGIEAIAAANLAAFTNAIAYIKSLSSQTILGGTLRFTGRHVVSGPVVVDGERIILEGVGGAGDGTGASEIRGHGVLGPVIRIKSRHCRLRNFQVSASNTRRTATVVTRDNYSGLGLTRDDQNYGVWVEADDVSGDIGADEFGFDNVWVHNQPNSSWVIMGGGYNSRISQCGSKDSNRHGLVIGDGKFTGRTNLRTAGVMSIVDWSSRGSQGHGCVVGDPTDVGGLVAVRILIHSMDNYSNAKNQTYLFDNYDSWIVADNSIIVDSGFSGNGASDITYPGQNGSIAVGGRNVLLRNTRLMLSGDGQAPVKIIGTHGTGTPRATECIIFDEGTHTLSPDATGPLAYLVDNTGNAANVTVNKHTLEGTFTALADGPISKGSRDELEFIYNTVLFGKQVVDDTTRGARIVSDANGALLSIVRNATTQILDRTTSGENVRFSRDGTPIGEIYTDSGTVALKSKTGKEVLLDVPSGSKIRLKAVTINFTGLPTSSAGLVSGDLWNDAGTIKIVP